MKSNRTTENHRQVLDSSTENEKMPSLTGSSFPRPNFGVSSFAGVTAPFSQASLLPSYTLKLAGASEALRPVCPSFLKFHLWGQQTSLRCQEINRLVGLVLLFLSETREVFTKVFHDVSQEVVINSETLKWKFTLRCINKSGLTKALLLVPNLLDCHRLPENI